MKIKNLLMQLFILTPLSLIQSFLGFMIILTPIAAYQQCSSESLEPSDLSGLYMLFMAWIFLFVLFIVCKIILRIKGHAVEYEYWDEEFVFSADYDVEKHKIYNVRKEKGGWTTANTPIVFLMVFISPVAFLFQLIALLFAFIGLGNNRIFSYYGQAPYQYCKVPILQAILHFLFNFVVISRQKYEQSKY